jgi:ureidoglycolate amidohydrolase
MINADPPATCDPRVVNAAEDAAKRLGLKHKKMVSRAYHDSLFVAEIAPTAMLFIPCFKGYSHRPDEYASPEDIKNGVEALAYALAQLSHH